VFRLHAGGQPLNPQFIHKSELCFLLGTLSGKVRLGFGVLEGVGIEVVVHGGVCIEVNDFEGVVDGCAAKATQIVAKTIVN